MGDDRWRFGATNFIPSVSTDGASISTNSRRVPSSPAPGQRQGLVLQRADVFYHDDSVYGLRAGRIACAAPTLTISTLPDRPDRANILTAGFLYNLSDNNHTGLSVSTGPDHSLASPDALHEHHSRPALLRARRTAEASFADSRSQLSDIPQGDQIFQITPSGNLGNYFVASRGIPTGSNGRAICICLPCTFWDAPGEVRVDLEREAFHQEEHAPRLRSPRRRQ